MSIQSFDSRYYAESLLKKYFKTFSYPFTHHQINSFDQFVSNDIPAIIKAANPILLLEEKIANTDEYAYKVEIFIGGLNGDQFFIGSPTLSLKNNEEIRILYPNEARLRNLTYASTVEASILVKITFTRPNESGKLEKHEVFLDSANKEYDYLARIPLFQLPIMLHSRYCLLHDKPNVFLKDVGECPYDYGGYFIVDGSEKVLITRQEQAFNTLYITKKESDPKSEIFASIQCLNPKTRLVKRVAFTLVKNKNTIEVIIPFVRKAVPLFVLFRAFGVQTDEDILRCIFPNENDTEAKILAPLLHETLLDAHPLLDTYSAIQYMKVLTKGFSEAHIYDILYNQTFIHVDNAPMNKALYLADCVRKILRVKANYDTSTDKDDIRNQRCLTSGFLIRMLFQNAYTTWTKQVARTIDKEYNYNKTIYSGQNFLNIFLPGNISTNFQIGYITQGINRGFKGKWSSGVGEEKTGVMQPLSRLSYLDFLSHCRRVVLDFDTSMGLQGPRRLHTTQFGYFCTSETPGGASIGITKNLSILTAISISMEPHKFTQWLYNKMEIIEANNLTPLMMKVAVPVYINSGIIGFCLKPQKLVEVCKLMKYTGCLPAYSSIVFNIRERRVSFYFDEGRPVRPIVFVHNGKYPYDKIKGTSTWRDLVMGSFELTKSYNIPNTIFTDPLESMETPSYEDYIDKLAPHIGCIEYVDPYESNEAYIAMYPELITRESTHVELHPSTMVGLLTSMIPFPNHNQSPRNQLSCSQSKQGISIYSTNYMNRYDNQTHVMCYGEAPLVRTLYYDYVADGQIGYGHNLVLAMGCFTGYNQEDGIVFNADSIQRGLFRNMTFRSYEAFEEDDDKAHTKTRIANPLNVPGWTALKSGVDYRKLDERGIVKKGEYVDENTVIIGRYIQAQGSDMKDASVTAQVWTSGTVQDVVVTINNKGLALVKIRVLQDRIPELGDKFCLTEEHDVLTEGRGWVSIKDVTIDDKVAQLNRETNCMEYVNPKEKFIFDCNEELYEIESQGVSLRTTMNHRMWVQSRNNKHYNLVEAKDIIGKRVRYQSDAPIGIDENDIKIEDYTFSKGCRANAWITFFGIWIAEGWTYIKESDYLYRVEFAANKEIVKIKLKEICEILDWKYSFNSVTNKFYVNEKSIAKYLDVLSVGAINKSLPKWTFKLSQSQSQLLVESLCIGDGYKTKTSLKYFTSSIKLKDDIQQLIQHAGWTSYSVIRYKEGWISPTLNSRGKEFKANADAWVIGIRKLRLRPTINHGHTNNQDGQKESIEYYQGKVYCISVPSEVFLVRRNGKITYTGNSNRHGQKGTIGMLVRAVDMPRSINGIVPDMIMNPHAIPSRMTIAQLLESILGKSACLAGFIGDATAFMNEGGIEQDIGNVLSSQFGLHKHGEEILYDGTTGVMIPSTIFMGNVYTMRLKHMVEDKWNARGEGRREQRTHQPTGGRGNQGGLRIGEMETWALEGHGIASFFRETLMKRSDGTEMVVCNGCGTVPIYNVKANFYLCSLCDGPVQFVGDNLNNFELLPTLKRSVTTFSRIEIPYSSEVLNKELNTYMNIGLRYLTAKDVTHLRRTKLRGLNEKEVKELLNAELQPREYKALNQPEFREEEEEVTATEEQLEQLGVVEEQPVDEEEEEQTEQMPQLSIKAAKESVDDMLNEEDTDDISVNQSVVESQPVVQMQTQPVMMQPVMMMMPVPAASVIESQVPNAPATLVVDTSQQAMQAQGIPTLKEDLRPRSILKRANSPSRFRSASNSPTNSSPKPTFSINKLDSSDSGSGNSGSSSSSSNMKINIVKEE